MSRIDTLVAALCPDGVEYQKLGDAAEIRRGDRITKKDLIPNGKYGVVSGGMDFFGRYDSYNREANTITVAQYGSAGFVNYVEERFWANDVCYSVFPSSCLDNKFLYYAMEANQQLLYGMTTKAIPDHLPKDKLQSLQIPVPPIEVQREIVRILDTFAELTDALTEELDCRRQQYAYYRDRLLSRERLEALDSKPVEMVRLGDVGAFTRGSGIQKKDFVESGMPCIHYGQVYTHYGLSARETKTTISPELYKTRKKANTGDLVIATTSENEEDVCKCVAWLGDKPCAVSGDAYIYSHSLDPKYVAYYFSSEGFQRQKSRAITGAKVLRVSGDSMAKFEIPVPSLATQQKVVDILDRFDTLTTSLTDGLPAEIEARRAQYTYYRDRLLDFPRKATGTE